MKIKAREFSGNTYTYGTLLFDLQNDPNQENQIIDSEVEKRMILLLRNEMKKSDAPVEQYERLGIPIDGEISDEHLRLEEKYTGTKEKIGKTEILWRNKGRSMYYLILRFTPEHLRERVINLYEKAINQKNLKEIDEDFIIETVWNSLLEGLKPLLKHIIPLVKKKAI